MPSLPYVQRRVSLKLRLPDDLAQAPDSVALRGTRNPSTLTGRSCRGRRTKRNGNGGMPTRRCRLPGASARATSCIERRGRHGDNGRRLGTAGSASSVGWRSPHLEQLAKKNAPTIVSLGGGRVEVCKIGKMDYRSPARAGPSRPVKATCLTLLRHGEHWTSAARASVPRSSLHRRSGRLAPPGQPAATARSLRSASWTAFVRQRAVRDSAHGACRPAAGTREATPRRHGSDVEPCVQPLPLDATHRPTRRR